MQRENVLGYLVVSLICLVFIVLFLANAQGKEGFAEGAIKACQSMGFETAYKDSAGRVSCVDDNVVVECVTTMKFNSSFGSWKIGHD